MLPRTAEDNLYLEIDRKAKTDAIRDARSGLVAIEALIESAINDNPPRFAPAEAHDIRDRYTYLTARVEIALDLLAQERDEFEQLNLYVRKLTDDLTAAKKQTKDDKEKGTYWYTEATRLRRIMEREGLDTEG